MRLTARVRGSVRLAAVGVLLGGLCVVLLVSGLFSRASARAGSRFRDRAIDATARALAWSSGMRVEIRGKPPEKPFILAANHLAYMDIVLVRLACGARFVSKSEVAQWPLVGRVASLTGAIFIERRNKKAIPRINDELADVLGSGAGVAVFPEGTSTAGASVGKFHAGLLAPAARSGFPVHTATIGYRTPYGPAADLVCWWGEMTFLDHLFRLLAMPFFEARITFAPEPVLNGDRKELADALREQVLLFFEPIQGAPHEL